MPSTLAKIFIIFTLVVVASLVARMIPTSSMEAFANPSDSKRIDKNGDKSPKTTSNETIAKKTDDKEAKSCKKTTEDSMDAFIFTGLHQEDSKMHIPNLFKKESRSCKFFPSTDDNFQCPKDYPFNTGANIGFGTSQITCNGETIKLEGAKAYANLGSKGRLKSIELISAGKHYSKAPKVKIIGSAKRKASAYSILNDSGSVREIVVQDGGFGYTETPTIHISKPKKNLKCNMCCRVNL